MTSRSTADRALLRLLGGRGGLLTAGEAAALTGCPLAAVESALLRLAVAGGADLRVGADGTVAYRFGSHLRRRLLARSWRLRVEATAHWLWRRIFGLIRLSFGLVLVALVSVISLLVLVIAVVQILGSDDGPEAVFQLLWAGLELLARLLVLLISDGFSGGFSGGLGGTGRDSSGRPVPDPQRKGSAAVAQSGVKRIAFFEAVYSPLFGDGDPNHAMERRRWVRIGCFLRHRGGAVIAEDLAPLLELPPRPADGQQAADIADGAMLAVLQRFDGRPAVNEHGDLAFHFPSLQVLAQEPSPRRSAPKAGPIDTPSASATPSAPAGQERPAPALRERSIPFSRTTTRQRKLYAGLCAALLLLSPALLAMAHPAPAPLVGLALGAMVYALLLLLVPLLRLQVLRLRNHGIALRNARRRNWGRFDPRSRGLLQRRRHFARGLARRQGLASAALAYTTEHDLLAQEIDAILRD